MLQLDAKCLLDAQATLAEGPSWDDARGLLTWVDIEAPAVHRFDPATGKDESWPVPSQVGFATKTLAGDYLLGTREGLARFDPGDGSCEVLADPEPHLASRFNDGKCDALGRLWAGTIADSRAAECALYRIDHDLSIHRIVEGISNGNGLCWSPEGDRFYYIDSTTRRIDAFDFDSLAGTLANRRVVVEVPEAAGLGKPDGMAIDAEGMLWSGMWGGGCVVQWNPHTGEQIGVVQVPCEQVTSCCFGGHGYRQLFITTARKLDAKQLESQPLAGGLFVCEPPVPGLPMYAFRG